MLSYSFYHLDPSYILVLSTAFIEATALLFLIIADSVSFIEKDPYLQLPNFVILATMASTLHNQLLFLLGRFFGNHLFKTFPKIEKKSIKINNIFQKYDILLILSMRYLYGLRIAAPTVLGMSQISWSRFLMYDLIGGLIWSSSLILTGYFFGMSLKQVLTCPNHYSLALISIIILFTLFIFLKKRYKNKE
ncbi:DedA family protein [Piscirickettsia litoralis]|uniref:VTT domain-containing protein n=1 Tax=Piscirickettsia litoralis TaxID=1891921 RepID=A0ABX3A2L7_9GAMM|nr:hypothetical protein BGC07_05440 [Piscirickettsia litoralis]